MQLALVFTCVDVHIWCGTFWKSTAHTWHVFLKDLSVFDFPSRHHVSHMYKNWPYFICILSIALEWKLGKSIIFHNFRIEIFRPYYFYQMLLLKHFFVSCLLLNEAESTLRQIYRPNWLSVSRLQEDWELMVFVLPANIQLPCCSFCICGLCLPDWKCYKKGEYRKIMTLHTQEVIGVSINT